jgi:hypothetical protein
MDHRQHLAREDGAIEDWNPAHPGQLIAARFGSFGGTAPRSNLLPRAIIFEDGKFCLIPSDSHSIARGRAAPLRKLAGQRIRRIENSELAILTWILLDLEEMWRFELALPLVVLLWRRGWQGMRTPKTASPLLTTTLAQ